MAIDPEIQAEFISVVRRSGLVDEATLTQILSEYANSDSRLFGDSVTSLTAMFVVKGMLTHWQAHKLRNGMYNGYWLDAYLLLDHLLSSGNFNLYLARDQRTGDLCKLKVFWPKLAEPPYYRYEVEEL